MMHFLKNKLLAALILALFCPVLALASADGNRQAQDPEREETQAQDPEREEAVAKYRAQTQKREEYEYGQIYSIKGVRDGVVEEDFHWQDNPLYEDPETHYQVWIRDTPDHLTDDEETQLLEIMKPLAAYGNVTFDLNFSKGDAADYYDKLYRDQGYADDSGILLVICEGSQTVSLFCQGKVQDHIDGKTAFDIGTKRYFDLRDETEKNHVFFTFAQERMAELYTFLSVSLRTVNPESGCTAWVMDGAQMFSADKRQEILEAVRDLAKDANILVCTRDNRSRSGGWPFEISYLFNENYLQIYLNKNGTTPVPFLSLETSRDFPVEISDNALKNLAQEFIPLYREDKIGSWLGQIYEAILENRSRNEISVTADSGYQIRITDTEDILSDEEQKQLLEIMGPVAEYGNVAFESYAGKESGRDYCRTNYQQKGFFDRSGTVFLMNMSERYLWLYTGGKMEKTISAKRAVSITDNVYRLASNEKYFECAAKVFDQEKILLRGGFILQPMRLICCLFIAFALSLLAVYQFICRERGIKSALPERVITMSGEVALAGAAAVTVTKTVVNSNSGGGGSSGGGGRGGGGFSGGGGGFSGGGHKF